MMLFRCAQITDLNAIYQLADHSGIGLTTLPKEQALLNQRIEWSTQSFKKKADEPLNEYYLFVLEDPENGQIVGTSAIEATTGHTLPFYSYKISKRTRICHSLGIRSDYEVLNLVNDNQGHSEICTLFLEPAYRHKANGLLLSRARFLFMAGFPQRFAPIVIADMRGVSDEKGNSPFWEHLGKHFFHMPFAEADRLTLATNKQFIADLMPRNPIYINLLDPEAQAVIGKPHESTVTATKILLREGFRFNNYVDIFDAGPTLEAARTQINTITNSRTMIINNISDEVSSKHYLLANTKLNFRATISQTVFNNNEDTCIVSKKTAALLEVEKGDSLRIAPLQYDKISFQ